MNFCQASEFPFAEIWRSALWSGYWTQATPYGTFSVSISQSPTSPVFFVTMWASTGSFRLRPLRSMSW